MKEVEIWGQLTKVKYLHFRSVFKDKLGSGEKVKRLAIQFWDRNRNNNLSTRIRITNGIPQIMQKIGFWEGESMWRFSETILYLPPELKQVYASYRILKNISAEKAEITIIQHDSEIYGTPDFEIKLARQFGKSERFIFEVELKNKKTDLKRIVDDLELGVYAKVTDTPFWDKWNRDVNLSAKDLGDEAVRKIISKYLRN